MAAMHAGDRLVAGVDLGGTNVRTCVARADGAILAQARTPTPADAGPAAVVERIVAGVRQVAKTAGVAVTQLVGVGVGAPGPLDMHSGVVFSPPNLAGWHDVPLAAMLRDALGIPANIGNDANLAAVGERTFGAGRGIDNLVYMTVSTGIGGGVIIAGRLFVGSSGTAGEIGHMTVDLNGPRCKCGNTGCLEAIAAGPAIARAGREAACGEAGSRLLALAGGDAEKVTTSLVVQAAQEGDGIAQAVFTRAAEAIGVGCVNLVNLFNPRRIIIGGGVAQAGELLFTPVRRIVAERALASPRDACTIVPAGLGDDCGLYGAVALMAHGIETLV
ncbi:MAG TPA: ROK family protein [Chloroflexota bacterium]|jgi:glucokinase|nr:ROK family protein [Chloroflexota bacterium]